MSEQEPRGFKIVDKRGMADEGEGKPSGAPPPPVPPREAGNRPEPEGVEGKKSPVDEPAAVGGPTFLDLVGTLQFGAMAHLGMIQTPAGRQGLDRHPRDPSGEDEGKPDVRGKRGDGRGTVPSPDGVSRGAERGAGRRREGEGIRKGKV